MIMAECDRNLCYDVLQGEEQDQNISFSLKEKLTIKRTNQEQKRGLGLETHKNQHSLYF